MISTLVSMPANSFVQMFRSLLHLPWCGELESFPSFVGCVLSHKKVEHGCAACLYGVQVLNLLAPVHGSTSMLVESIQYRVILELSCGTVHSIIVFCIVCTLVWFNMSLMVQYVM